MSECRPQLNPGFHSQFWDRGKMGIVRHALMTTVTFVIGLQMCPSVLAQELTTEQWPQTDIPEEVLQGEIILDARSPIDGSPLTPSEYAQLEDQLQVARGEVPGRLAPKIHRALLLLRLRKVIITLFPFLQ